AQAAQSPGGVASNGRILDEPRLRSMEDVSSRLRLGDAVPGSRLIFARKSASDNGSSLLRWVARRAPVRRHARSVRRVDQALRFDDTGRSRVEGALGTLAVQGGG